MSWRLNFIPLNKTRVEKNGSHRLIDWSLVQEYPQRDSKTIILMCLLVLTLIGEIIYLLSVIV